VTVAPATLKFTGPEAGTGVNIVVAVQVGAAVVETLVGTKPVPVKLHANVTGVMLHAPPAVTVAVPDGGLVPV
jgi:hypothetical protein